MKYAKLAVTVFVLFFLGYVLAPTLTPMLIKTVQSEEESLTREVKYRGAIYPINLKEYRGDDLPKTVKMEVLTELATNSGEGRKQIKKGEEVKLLNRDGKELIIETLDGLAKGNVSPFDTDIFGRLAQAKYDYEALKATGGAPTPPKPAPPVVVTPKKDPVEPTPPPVVVTPKKDPVIVGGGDMPKEADPASPPAGELKRLTPEEIVELMKTFIAAGTLKEFKENQVEGWKAADDESFDGVTYQIGMAAYKAKTIFGERTVHAKALIRGGKIDRWLFAKSGMEMR